MVRASKAMAAIFWISAPLFVVCLGLSAGPWVQLSSWPVAALAALLLICSAFLTGEHYPGYVLPGNEKSRRASSDISPVYPAALFMLMLLGGFHLLF
jgi:hypothetical protein